MVCFFCGALQFVAVQNELRHPRARQPLVHGLLFNGTMRLGLAQVPAFDQQALGPVYQANFVQLAVQLLIFAAERLQAVVRGGRQLDRLLQYLWGE